MSGLLHVQRRADGRLSKAEKLPNGGIRVPAALTRTGVFKYARADGSIVREYRPESEVFHADSLRSLRGVPVTDLHPPQMISRANFKRFTEGHVGDESRRDGDHLAADVVINGDALIAKVDGGKAREVSMGYECRIDATPGTAPNGEAYDVVQRDIRYNHAAIGPDGWGRAGRNASLRLDGVEGDVYRLDAEGHQLPFEHTDDNAGRDAPPSQRFDSMPSIRIDGIDYDPSTPAFTQAFTKFMARADAAIAEVAALKADLTKQSARADSAEAEVKDLKTKLTEASSPAHMDAAVAERVALQTKAAKLLPADVKLDGKAPAEIKRLVVEHNRKALKLDGKGDDYIAAVFDSIEEPAGDDERSGRIDHSVALRQHTAPGGDPGARRFIRTDRLTLPTSNG